MKAPPHPPAGHRTFESTPFLAVALLSLTLLVFVPAHLYLRNRSGVLVFLPDVLTVTTLFAAGAGLILAALLAIMPPAIRLRLTVLTLGVSFLSWVHAYCLVWHYDVLDGRDIPWAAYTGRAIVDAGLWILVLGSLLWFAPRVYPLAGRVCGALIAIQLASLGINAAGAYISPLDFFKHYYVERTSAFTFSTERNVIVIMLDEFQSDIFAEAVLPRTEYRSHFNGFTYFPDTVAGANFTELALPAILTGNIYDNATPRAEFLRKAYLENSLPAALKRAGVEVEVYPWRGLANEAIYYDETVASNFKRRPRPWPDKLVDIARLVDLGIFRSAPQFAKRYVYNNSEGRLSALLTRTLDRAPSSGASAPPDGEAGPEEIGLGFVLDNEFLRLAREGSVPENKFATREGRTVFKFYHLAGLHVPVKMKRDLTVGVFDYNRANFSENAEAYARIMGAFLEELKRLNVYDNSMIVILGDHGSGRSAELYVSPGPAPRINELNRTAAGGDFQRDKARAIPLLLVKRFGEKGEIKTSRAPAAMIDIPATVLAELNLKHPPVYALPGRKDFHGIPLFELRENQPRERYYGAIEWSAAEDDFVKPISLYRISGFSWSDDSWGFVETMPPRRGIDRDRR